MSTMPPKSYEDVLAAANRVLDLFAAALEHWRLGRDEGTRKHRLAFALETSTYFKREDAATRRCSGWGGPGVGRPALESGERTWPSS